MKTVLATFDKYKNRKEFKGNKDIYGYKTFDDLAAALGTDINGILALPTLGEVLKYHVLGSEVLAAAITNGQIVAPLSTVNTLKLTKTTTGIHKYDISCMSVENYIRNFQGDSDNRINFFEINNTSRLESGTVLFLGPSNDPEYYGKTEYVTVNSVVGNRVYLTTRLVNQYKNNDSVSFHTAFYLFSNKGYA
jgi:hypothetical protein